MGRAVNNYGHLNCGLLTNSYCSYLDSKWGSPSARIAVSLSKAVDGGPRLRVLRQVDEELSNGNERAALTLVRDLQGKPGGLRCFGSSRQSCKMVVGLFALEIPQRLYSLDELKLNGVETTSLLSPVDKTLGSIETNLQVAALLGGVVAWNVFELNPQQVLFFSLGYLFLWTLDAVSFNGGISGLLLDTIGHSFSQKYHNRVIQHEAGHFLTAYLVGILPKGYTITSLEAFKKEGSLNVQAGTAFVDFEFNEEVNRGKLSATMLNRFSCIALAGVVTEYLLFGSAEGGLADIGKGAIPTGGQFLSFPSSIFEDNSGLCGTIISPCTGNNTGIQPAIPVTSKKMFGRNCILGVTISIGVGIAILLAVVLLKMLRRELRNSIDDLEDEISGPSRFYDALGPSKLVLFQNSECKDLTGVDILKGTNNFSQSSCGRFGLVYKTDLPNGKTAAIKRLSGDCGQMEREFQAEVEALSRA